MENQKFGGSSQIVFSAMAHHKCGSPGEHGDGRRAGPCPQKKHGHAQSSAPGEHGDGRKGGARAPKQHAQAKTCVQLRGSKSALQVRLRRVSEAGGEKGGPDLRESRSAAGRESRIRTRQARQARRRAAEGMGPWPGGQLLASSSSCSSSFCAARPPASCWAVVGIGPWPGFAHGL